MTKMLSPHFSLAEMVITQVRDVDNTPGETELANLTQTAERMEIVRGILGNKPITVSSGYRSPEVNERVGGSKTSAHMSGWAVDFICPGFGSPLDVCREIGMSGIHFDQCIYEYEAWCHLSFHPDMRHQVLTKKSGQPYVAGLPTAGA